MDIGVFIPIGNNGWLISTTSPQYKPSFDLNRTIVEKAEGMLKSMRLHGLNEDTLRQFVCKYAGERWEEFYETLDRRLGSDASPVAKLRWCAEFSAEDGGALGEWALWLEIWVQALRDGTSRATREQLDRRLRDTLAEAI